MVGLAAIAAAVAVAAVAAAAAVAPDVGDELAPDVEYGVVGVDVGFVEAVGSVGAAAGAVGVDFVGIGVGAAADVVDVGFVGVAADVVVGVDSAEAVDGADAAAAAEVVGAVAGDGEAAAIGVVAGAGAIGADDEVVGVVVAAVGGAVAAGAEDVVVVGLFALYAAGSPNWPHPPEAGDRMLGVGVLVVAVAHCLAVTVLKDLAHLVQRLPSEVSSSLLWLHEPLAGVQV